MKLKKIIISTFLVISFIIMSVLPVFAANNIILIQDSYYYSQNGTYITSQCGTSAGEAERHRAVAEAISHVYGTTTKYGSFGPFNSSATATQYIGNHSDDYNNYFQRESEVIG